MEKTSKVIYTISCVCLLLSLLISIIDGCCFSRSFYKEEYAKNHTAEVIGMSQEDLDTTTDVLLGYLQDERDNLNTTAIVHGYVREVFDAREKAHMVDVKNLYQNALLVRNVTAVVGLVGILIAFLLYRKEFVEPFSTGFKIAILLFLGFLGIIAIFAIADFETFWIQFHYLFFDNDLFFLDPNTEILINMVPETFFSDLVFRIILWFTGILVTVWVALHYAKKRTVSHA